MHRPGGGNSHPCYMTGTRAVRSRKRGRGEWCGRKGVLSGRREAAFSAQRFLRAWSIKPQGFNAITDSLSGHLGVAAQATTQQLNVKKHISQSWDPQRVLKSREFESTQLWDYSPSILDLLHNFLSCKPVFVKRKAKVRGRCMELLSKSAAPLLILTHSNKTPLSSLPGVSMCAFI